MNYIVSKVLDFITEQNVISNKEEVQDFYRYGIEISISSLLNIILVVAVGFIIHHVLESLIFLSIFIGFVCFNVITVLVLGPVENKNKPIEHFKKIKLKIIGLIVTLIINYVGILFIRSYIGTMIIFTSFLIAILMFAAIIKEKPAKKNQ